MKSVLPNSKIECINGEWFSWYGSGMVTAFEELNKWRKDLVVYGK